MKIQWMGVLLASASVAWAESAPVPVNWLLHESVEGMYAAALDSEFQFEGGTSGRLRAMAPGNGFGTLLQACDAQPFAGKRVQFKAKMRTAGADRAWLWLRGDRADGTAMAFDNMQDRALSGDADWSEQSVVLDIPSDVVALAYGVGLRGAGEVWMDAASLQVVSAAVPVTEASRTGPVKLPMPSQIIVPAATNLDFEL